MAGSPPTGPFPHRQQLAPWRQTQK
jgi:hypothetical protein